MSAPVPDDLVAPRLQNFDTEVPSVRGQVSHEEWRARVDLAACYRLIDFYGMSDLIANHVSVRVPGSRATVWRPARDKLCRASPSWSPTWLQASSTDGRPPAPTAPPLPRDK
jgi:hypothetical protein